MEDKVDQLSDAIALLVREAGAEEFKFPPFDSWEELQAARVENGLEEEFSSEERMSDELRIALSCLSSFHAYLSNLAFAYFVRLFVKKQQNPKNQAGFTLSSGIAADVGAIDVLCRSGFDIQAKQIVRGLREKVDCLIAVQLDRGFAVQFVAAAGSDDANRFWHQRISRGKLKKLISLRLQRLAKMARSPLDKEWFQRRENFERWLGEAVHPSHTTGLLSAFPNFGATTYGPDDLGWWGAPSDISLSTIKSVLGFAYEFDLLINWRDLIEASDFDPIAMSEHDADFFLYHQSLEGFIRRCTANSMIKPNLDIMKLYAWVGGSMFVPDGEEIDAKEYEREMLNILSGLIEKAERRLRENFENLKEDSE